MSDVNDATKEFTNEIGTATEMLKYITENTKELGPLEIVMFGAALIEFGNRIRPIY